METQKRLVTATTAKELNLRKTEASRKANNKVKDLAAASQNWKTIYFDLQKTFLTLLMHSNAYYLQKLWISNLRVHNLVTD